MRRLLLSFTGLALVIACTASAATPGSPLSGATAASVCRTASIPYPPHALASAGGSLWIACRDRGTIERRSATGRLIATIKTPGLRVWGVAAAGGSVWAIDRDLPYLLRIAPATNTVKQFALPEAPIELSAGAGSLWVAYDASGRVSRIDPRTGKAGTGLPVGDGPSGFASDGASVWAVAHRDGSLVRIAGAKATHLSTQAAGQTVTPERIAWAGGSLWITGRGKDLDRVDPATGKLLGTTEIGAAGIDLVPVGSRLAVVAATPQGARRGDPTVASVSLVDREGRVTKRFAATGALSLTGLTALGKTLVLLDGLHGRLLTLRAG